MAKLPDTFCTFCCRPHQANTASPRHIVVMGAHVEDLKVENSVLRTEVEQLQVSKRETKALLV